VKERVGKTALFMEFLLRRKIGGNKKKGEAKSQNYSPTVTSGPDIRFK